MTWRSVYIESDVRLCIKNRQLTANFKDGQSSSVPVEDIAAVVLESQHASLTTAVLSALMDANAVVLVCNKAHIPSGILMNSFGSYQALKTTNLQTKASKPLKKRIWQKIVKRKIENQAIVVSFNLEASNKVRAYASKVRSGDSGNVEAIAAREYWRNIFSNEFKRGQESSLNSALDYGYAVLRGMVARAVCISGLIPQLGIYHKARLNPFNLADDLMEVLRPVVDKLVLDNKGQFDEGLCSSNKRLLVGVSQQEVLIDGEQRNILRATEIMTGSFATALEVGDSAVLRLPEIIQ